MASEMVCPLTGNHCTNVKDIPVQYNHNGEFEKTYICVECSVFSQLQIEIGNLFLENFSKHLQNVSGRLSNDPCPSCGITVSGIVKNNKFGCANCYKHFHDFFLYLIEKVQDGSSRHIGKIPLNSLQIDSLISLMRKAVEEERYEDAAVFRDKIKEKQKT